LGRDASAETFHVWVCVLVFVDGSVCSSLWMGLSARLC
jgi:hypothetical protein